MGHRRRPAVVGHRGAMGSEPENTLRSFRRAVTEGADAIELDIRMSRDGALVICHDAKVDRTTRGTGLVGELPLTELRELDAGEGERIPTFEEVLEVIGELPLQAEIKAVDAVPLLVQTLRGRDLVERVTVTSFHARMLESARRLAPEIPRGLVVEHFRGLHENVSGSDAHVAERDTDASWGGKPPADALEQALALGAAWLCPGLTGLTAADVEACHENGVQVCAWLVNDADQFDTATSHGVDAVTSDFPGLFISDRV